MEIVFNSQSKQIDANTLIVALGHYQTIVAEANKAMGGEKTIELKVNALKQGSFIIDVSVVESLIKQIFSGDSVEYIAAVCTIVGGVYGAYHILKGRAAKSEEDKDKIKVKINIGNKTIVNNGIINIYNNVAIREAISKTIEAAQEDTSVEGFVVKSETETVEFRRSDFSEYIHSSFKDEQMLPPDKVEVEHTIMTIVSMSFEAGNSWVFLYNGFKIPIRVKDNVLMDLINQGERFGKGDSIEVDLEIIQKYNPDYRGYENKIYRIVKFYQHNVSPEQPPII